MLGLGTESPRGFPALLGTGREALKEPQEEEVQTKPQGLVRGGGAASCQGSGSLQESFPAIPGPTSRRPCLAGSLLKLAMRESPQDWPTSEVQLPPTPQPWTNTPCLWAGPQGTQAPGLCLRCYRSGRESGSENHNYSPFSQGAPNLGCFPPGRLRTSPQFIETQGGGGKETNIC